VTLCVSSLLGVRKCFVVTCCLHIHGTLYRAFVEKAGNWHRGNIASYLSNYAATLTDWPLSVSVPAWALCPCGYGVPIWAAQLQSAISMRDLRDYIHCVLNFRNVGKFYLSMWHHIPEHKQSIVTYYVSDKYLNGKFVFICRWLLGLYSFSCPVWIFGKISAFRHEWALVFRLVTETTVWQLWNTDCPVYIVCEHGNFIA
jgi:hypothetical protein